MRPSFFVRSYRSRYASSRALDDLYHVDPPPAAHKIRELFYNLFMFEDHTLHFYFLGGPDFIVGPAADPAWPTRPPRSADAQRDISSVPSPKMLSPFLA